MDYIEIIQNGDRGLTVRQKINSAIDRVNNSPDDFDPAGSAQAVQDALTDQLNEKISTGEVGIEEVTTSTGTQTMLEALDQRAVIIEDPSALPSIAPVAGNNIAISGNGLYQYDSTISRLPEDGILRIKPDNPELTGLWVLKQGRVLESPEITVGDGGWFSSLNEAIDYAANLWIGQTDKNLKIKIILMSGFTLEEQVFVYAKNLSFIEISSIDPIVTIDRQSMVSNFLSVRKPAFGAMDGASFPVVSALFQFNGTGSAENIMGFYAYNNSYGIFTPGSGITDAGFMNLRVEKGGCVVAPGSFWQRAKSGNASENRNVLITEGASAILTGADISSPESDDCIRISKNAHLEAFDLIASNSPNSGVRITMGSTANLEGLVANDNGGVGLTVEHGSTVNCRVGTMNRNSKGARVTGGSSLDLSLSVNCDDNAEGIEALDGGSSIAASGILARNCTGFWAVLADNGAVVDIFNGDVSGAVGSTGILARNGGSIIGRGANCQRGASPAPSDIRVINGGTITAHSATGGLSQTANTITADGIIYQ